MKKDEMQTICFFIKDIAKQEMRRNLQNLSLFLISNFLFLTASKEGNKRRLGTLSVYVENFYLLKELTVIVPGLPWILLQNYPQNVASMVLVLCLDLCVRF